MLRGYTAVYFPRMLRCLLVALALSACSHKEPKPFCVEHICKRALTNECLCDNYRHFEDMPNGDVKCACPRDAG